MHTHVIILNNKFCRILKINASQICYQSNCKSSRKINYKFYSVLDRLKDKVLSDEILKTRYCCIFKNAVVALTNCIKVLQMLGNHFWKIQAFMRGNEKFMVLLRHLVCHSNLKTIITYLMSIFIAEKDDSSLDGVVDSSLKWMFNNC